MGPEIEWAQRALAAAIGGEKVRAWGRLTLDSEMREIPSSKFRHTGLVVDFTGELVTSAPHRTSAERRIKWIEFDEDEVKRAFPTPPPPNAAQWMLNEAKSLQALGRKGKRADMVKDCMSATGCKKRPAEDAHAALPAEFKRPRGKSPKLSG
ncbi:MAG: hypothetical protein WBF58_01190 [Xanthobacteraceae bacterium]